MGQGIGESKTSPRRVNWALQRARAVQMRISGAPYAQIAEATGYKSAKTCATAVSNEVDTIPLEAAEELRVVELLRLDRMLFAIWPAVQQGALDAIDRALRISERRCRLVPGLEVPRNYVVEGSGNDKATQISILVQQFAADPVALDLASQLANAAADRLALDAGLDGPGLVGWQVGAGEASRLLEPPSNGNGSNAEQPADRPDAGEARQE